MVRFCIGSRLTSGRDPADGSAGPKYDACTASAAKQYGINLPQAQGTSSSGGDSLGAAGEPLEQASSNDESADKETQPDDLAGAVDQRLPRYGRSIFNKMCRLSRLQMMRPFLRLSTRSGRSAGGAAVR